MGKAGHSEERDIKETEKNSLPYAPSVYYCSHIISSKLLASLHAWDSGQEGVNNM